MIIKYKVYKKRNFESIQLAVIFRHFKIQNYKYRTLRIVKPVALGSRKLKKIKPSMAIRFSRTIVVMSEDVRLVPSSYNILGL